MSERPRQCTDCGTWAEATHFISLESGYYDEHECRECRWHKYLKRRDELDEADLEMHPFTQFAPTTDDTDAVERPDRILHTRYESSDNLSDDCMPDGVDRTYKNEARRIRAIKERGRFWGFVWAYDMRKKRGEPDAGDDVVTATPKASEAAIKDATNKIDALATKLTIVAKGVDEIRNKRPEGNAGADAEAATTKIDELGEKLDALVDSVKKVFKERHVAKATAVDNDRIIIPQHILEVLRSRGRRVTANTDVEVLIDECVRGSGWWDDRDEEDHGDSHLAAYRRILHDAKNNKQKGEIDNGGASTSAQGSTKKRTATDVAALTALHKPRQAAVTKTREQDALIAELQQRHRLADAGAQRQENSVAEANKPATFTTRRTSKRRRVCSNE